MAIGFLWTALLFGVFIGILTADKMGLFGNQNHFPVDGRTIIVTGGSQGMGRGVAKMLAQKGANVVIVARNIKKLEAAVEYISSAAARPQLQRFHFISADLMNPEAATGVIREVTAWNHGAQPDVVWCCAGTAHPDLFLNTPIERHKQEMDSNYFSAAYIAHAVLKAWLNPGATQSQDTKPTSEATSVLPLPRHLIFTSSVLAFYPLLGYSPYAPSKAALRSLSDTLSQELQLYNGARRKDPSLGTQADVRIHTVFPGTIFSPSYVEENKIKPAITKKLEEGDDGQTEDEVAAVSIKALERGQYLITTSLLGAAMKATALGGSPRNNRVIDTLFSWAASLVMLFVLWDFNRKAWNWGRSNGIPRSLSEQSM
ncbi:MAG: 3-dehydrosphinganine reductase [Pleopsidium flavum]|nr:MAG: 3-dehydrosphinganine reductase [Pleopsidium flavum]